MKLAELQRIVLRLGNQFHTRYWIHWNYPTREPWLMAINIRHFDETIINERLVAELKSLGFELQCVEDIFYWVTERDPDEVL